MQVVASQPQFVVSDRPGYQMLSRKFHHCNSDRTMVAGQWPEQTRIEHLAITICLNHKTCLFRYLQLMAIDPVDAQ